MAQNYQTYVEVDLSDNYTVTPSKIEVTALVRGQANDALVYKDFGVNFFDGDFEHKVDTKSGAVVGVVTSPIVGFWCLANDIDDLYALLTTGVSILSAYISKNLTEDYIALREQDGVSGYSDLSLVTYGNKFYHTIIRDESVGTYGTLYCYIYSDSNRTVLFDTLSVALHSSKKDFQYNYGAMSWNDGTDSSSISADFENLDLGLVAISSRRKIIQQRMLNV